MPRYFVKFVKFNLHTIEALINKQVKFSTVYEFNDFNELRYRAYNFPSPNVKNLILDRMNDSEIQYNLVNNALNSGVYSRDYMDAFKARLTLFNTGDPAIFEKYKPHNDWPLLMENFAFSSVGIFCISDISVFKDDSAQLMFAHYADDLKGLALVYEMSDNTKLTDMHYHKFDEPQDSSGNPDRLKSYLNGIFDDVEDFNKKSNKWEYEKEKRMFGKPGIYDAETKGIILKAILYSPRFPLKSINTLKNINAKHYLNMLKIEELKPSNTHCKFHIDNLDVYEWIVKNLGNKN